MAIRYPLVINDKGEVAELPEGDSLPPNLQTIYASQVLYSNQTSQLSAIEVQSAIDELAEERKNIFGGIVTLPNINRVGDGTVTIDVGCVANFYPVADASQAVVQIANIPASGVLAPADLTTTYIYLDYNGGNPTWNLGTDPNIFFADGRKVAAFRVMREGTWVHILDYDQYGTALANKAYFKDVALRGFERQSGLILSTYDTRKIAITAGSAWFAATLYPLPASDSATTNFFEYRLASGVWSKNSITEYDSRYYSDGTDRLLLGNNKWSARYIFRSVGSDNEVFTVLGNQYNTEALAIAEFIPNLPFIIPAHAIYVGKIVVQQGATIGTAYPRVWGEAVIAAPINYHNDLSGIQLAESGVTYGHVTDQTQSITGQKNFLTRALIGTDTWDTYSALQVAGRFRATGHSGIGSSSNTQTAFRIDIETLGDVQSGIRNYTKFSAGGTGQYHGYTSDQQIPVGVTIPIAYHASFGDSFNLGTVQTGGYIRMAAQTNANYTSFFGIISAIAEAAYDSYFIRHIGTAKSAFVGPTILGADVAWDSWSKAQVEGNIKYTGFESYPISEVISASATLPAGYVSRCYASCEIASGQSLEIPAGSVLYIE